MSLTCTMPGTGSTPLHEAVGEICPRGRVCHTLHTQLIPKPAVTDSLTTTALQGVGAPVSVPSLHLKVTGSFTCDGAASGELAHESPVLYSPAAATVSHTAELLVGSQRMSR